MSTVATSTEPRKADSALTHNPVAQAVRAGLSATAKSLPAWLFYDAEGSCLFERITELPEYYLTRTERGIFHQHADSIIAAARATQRHESGRVANTGAALRLLELGAGTATKTGILLAAAVRAQGTTVYLPIDVSATAIDEACASLTATLPQVHIVPQVANYLTDELAIPAHDGRTLALYIGSSIGNFSPAEAQSVLRNLRSQLQPGDTLLLGTDLVKNTAVLEAAYADAAGVTAAFNLNLLRRLNRELGADFNLNAFRHIACFNREASRIEMHLQSTHAQTVRIPAIDLTVVFQASESIHTENSYKFTAASITHLLQVSGFSPIQTYTDEQNYFAVTLAQVTQ